MLGAIYGDVIGSVYERHPTKDPGCKLINDEACPTDDSVLSVAVASAILAAGGKPGVADYAAALRRFGRRYPDAGYGKSFRQWLKADDSGPYQSWGNGSAMRASAIGWAFDDEAEVLRQAELSAMPTHDHPEGIKGAQAVALAVFMARSGADKAAIRAAIESRFSYDLQRSVAAIRPAYRFQVSCQESVPEAIIAFLDSSSFEDAVRQAIALGGDADTQACIAGAIAEAFYGGVPAWLAAWVLPRLESGLLETLIRFARQYLPAGQRIAIEAELAARALPHGAGLSRESADGRRSSATFYPTSLNAAPDYSITLHAESWQSLQDYASRLRQAPDLAGARLRARLDAEAPAGRPLAGQQVLQALLDTKRPCIFAETAVHGDGSDWTLRELGLLGDIGFALPVCVFDDGRHQGAIAHEPPLAATLLYIPGALLASGYGTPADAQVLLGGQIDQAAYTRLYERRLLPLLRYASDAALAGGSSALVTIPGLGCGQFAGRLRGSLGSHLRDALVSILERNAAVLPGIRAVWFDPHDECDNGRQQFGGLSFLVRPLARNQRMGTGLGRPQLCAPADYAEAEDDFDDCSLFSVVAWDQVSWTGNDFWAGSRATDDGVKAAASDTMFVLTGFRGNYDGRAAAYLPPSGAASWEQLVQEQGLRLKSGGRLLVYDPERSTLRSPG